MSCHNALGKPERPPDRRAAEGYYQETGSELPPPDYAWTDLTYLLHMEGVRWANYVSKGTQPDCANDEMFCHNVMQDARHLESPPLLRHRAPGRPAPQYPNYLELLQGGRGRHAAGGLVGNTRRREQRAPPALVSTGQAYVTGLINTVMRGPDWDSTAIFLIWDHWGGFYDHAVSPKVDQDGYGLRVPGLVISPYAKRGYVDHQTLSFDTYLKFAEDDFLGGQRIDPRTDDRTHGPTCGMILPEHPPARLGMRRRASP